MATALAAPDRTIVQRDRALQLANQVRFRRARLKRELKRLPKPVAYGAVRDHLLNPAPELETMRVRDLLRALPWWGDSKADRALFCCQVASSKTLGGLTVRQRHALAARIGTA